LISSKWIVWICPQIRFIKNSQYIAPLLADDHVRFSTMVASPMDFDRDLFEHRCRHPSTLAAKEQTTDFRVLQ
jgi:hypothetical protein